jgi:hypothetical protein
MHQERALEHLRSAKPINKMVYLEVRRVVSRTMTKVMVVLLDVMLEAFSRQGPFADLKYKRVMDVRSPEGKIGLDEVGSERVRVMYGWPGH